jgi:hypothetical protein
MPPDVTRVGGDHTTDERWLAGTDRGSHRSARLSAWSRNCRARGSSNAPTLDTSPASTDRGTSSVSSCPATHRAFRSARSRLHVRAYVRRSRAARNRASSGVAAGVGAAVGRSRDCVAMGLGIAARRDVRAASPGPPQQPHRNSDNKDQTNHDLHSPSPSFAASSTRCAQPTDRYPCQAIPRGARPDVPMQGGC